MDRTYVVLPRDQGEEIAVTIKKAAVIKAPIYKQFPMITLSLPGLISDGQLVDFSGSLVMEILTQAIELNIPITFYPSCDEFYMVMDSVPAIIYQRLHLAANTLMWAHCAGNITIRIPLLTYSIKGEISISPASLSQAVLTLISDHVDFTLDELQDRTLDELMYKEVN